MRFISKIIIVLLLGFSFCKKAQTMLSKEEMESIEIIFQENQKVIDFLLNNENLLPSISTLKDSISKAKLLVKNADVNSTLEKLEASLQEYNENEKEKSFLSLSRFSEELDKLAVLLNLKDYHKFFCPMVSKYWVAKGESIHNPYASEMRECGELVR
ncbi:MAG: hypothetical protein N3A69_00585 [Leptospiraceae bacterium]|nr:hypothetical protein [Leptospiraceae bacterium]